MSLLSFTLEELKKLSPKDFFKRLYTKVIDEEDLMSAAAQVAFYFAFALFPLLLFLVTLFGIVLESADDFRGEMFFYLKQVMPGSAYELVQTTIDEVTKSSTGGKLTFGLLAALWSASAGVDSIRIALNGVYNLTESRPWWKTKLVSLLLTLGLAVLVTIALGVVFYGGKFIGLILNSINLSISSPFFLGILQVVTVLIVLISIFAIIYNYLPKHKKYTWVWVTPGAILGILLWLALSYAFRLYLGYFDSYNKTYGSLGAVIILMLWLYLTALVIIIGGTINAVLQEFTDPETAEAAANKAAAKVIIENPHKGSISEVTEATDKKAETLAILNKNTVQKTDKPKSNATVIIENESPVKKSKFKLIAGIVIGFVSNLRKR